MAKTTFWDIIEKTIEKVGTPLSAKEIYEALMMKSLKHYCKGRWVSRYAPSASNLLLLR